MIELSYARAVERLGAAGAPILFVNGHGRDPVSGEARPMEQRAMFLSGDPASDGDAIAEMLRAVVEGCPGELIAGVQALAAGDWQFTLKWRDAVPRAELCRAR